MNKLICGAKSRSNNHEPCKLPPMENGRCRFHGGKTPIKHGYYTKKAILERRKLRFLLMNYKESLDQFLL
jgi:hypothetical protein